jgi:hypothetical protein
LETKEDRLIESQINLLELLMDQKLFEFQKAYLRFLIKNRDKQGFITYPRRMGRTQVINFMNKWNEIFNSNEERNNGDINH